MREAPTALGVRLTATMRSRVYAVQGAATLERHTRPTTQCHHMTVRIDGSVEKKRGKRVSANGRSGTVSNQGRISTVSEARVDITTDPQNNRPHRRGCG
jgi:hypothetical protein